MNVLLKCERAIALPLVRGIKHPVGTLSNKSGADYKSTLNLPTTTFPLRPNAPLNEAATQKKAEFNSLYEWQWNRSDELPVFCLHDGPPYTNGDTHIGHALNKTLKDVVVRFKMMRGYRVHYVPGWDCHGLPIELKALQSGEGQTMSPLAIRSKARQFAEKCMKQQMRSFQRWGLLADWSNIYRTMDKEYEANQLRIFFRMYEKGHIYRGTKPVFWSPSSRTALAEAELEYFDITSKSVYVKLPVSEAAVPVFMKSERMPLSLLVWTTTPWTLPANKAVCYNPDSQYSIVTLSGNKEEAFIVAAERIESLERTLEQSVNILKTFPGSALKGLKYQHPLEDNTVCPLLPGGHVTMESGSGLVHTAPAHGQDDHLVGREFGLDLTCCVDEHGRFVGGEFEGREVLGEGNDAVIERLEERQCLVKMSGFRHRYPHDWRTKKPVILRSTPQWFASLTELKHQAEECLRTVKMTPPVSINRMVSMLGSRDDWCISRQRVWGVPIPVFYEEETGNAFMNKQSVDHVISLVEQHGTDCWWSLPMDQLLPHSIASQSGMKGELVPGKDTMDVWFDSGSSWATVLQDVPNGVADLYLEGSDQHRGWFQSSLLTRTAFDNQAPYKHVITHGFVLDQDGQKMSKSIGNVVSPDDIIAGTKGKPGIGADVLRLWAASVDYTSVVSIGSNILSETSEVFRRIRNTSRFMLGSLHDFNPDNDLLAYEDMHLLDQYLLHLLYLYSDNVTSAYEEANFAKVSHFLKNLVTVDLSALYFDSVKDRLYVEGTGSSSRRSAQTTLFHVLTALTKSFAPILPHLAEEIYVHRRRRAGELNSAFKNGWMDCPAEWHRPDLASDFEIGRQVRELGHQALEMARAEKAIGSSLDADLIIFASPGPIFQALQRLHGSVGTCGTSILGEMLVVSHVTLLCANGGEGREAVEHLHVAVPQKEYGVKGPVQGKDGECDVVLVEAQHCCFHKCPRCWKLWSAEEGYLCQRCQQVLKDLETTEQMAVKR